MSFEHTLKRLHPFEGLCLTAADLADEQLYHRRTLHRHSLFLHGFGVVQACKSNSSRSANATRSSSRLRDHQ